MHPIVTPADTHQWAARARSALACPAAASMVIKGTEHLFGGDDLGLQDRDGTPTLVCRVGSAIDAAATSHHKALLRVISGVVEDDGATESVVLAGRLGDPDPCCEPTLRTVAIEPSIIMLIRTHADGSSRQYRVPVSAFRSPDHALNQGYLRRSLGHINDCHGDELRQAVSLCTGTPASALVGAGLSALSPTGVDVTWVDADGGHHRRVGFGEAARTPLQLAELLQEHLHSGLC